MKNSSKTGVLGAALCVHIFTASGLLAGFLSLVAINARDWRLAMGWLLVAFLIDGIDGSLARAFKVKENLPQINGKTIDYVVDFVNYAIVPTCFLYYSELLPIGLALPVSFVVLLVSAIYYGREGMVSSDQYFVGFPVMWNMVVFYLMFVFSFSAWINVAIVIGCAVMHFLPIKFAYPSRATKWKSLTVGSSALLFLVSPAIVWLYPNTPAWMKLIAALCLGYFIVLAFIVTFFDSQPVTESKHMSEASHPPG